MGAVFSLSTRRCRAHPMGGDGRDAMRDHDYAPIGILNLHTERPGSHSPGRREHRPTAQSRFFLLISKVSLKIRLTRGGVKWNGPCQSPSRRHSKTLAFAMP